MSDIEREAKSELSILRTQDEQKNIFDWLKKESSSKSGFLDLLLFNIRSMFASYRQWEDATRDRIRLIEAGHKHFAERLEKEGIPQYAENFQHWRRRTKETLDTFIYDECKARTGAGGSHLE